MNLPVVLTLDAETDFDTAADFYQQQAGLGDRFTDSVRQSLRAIGQMPESHAPLHRDVRRTKVRPFPYIIYYRVRPDRVEVIAILHGRRDPSVWKDRL